MTSCAVLDGSSGGRDPFEISDHRPIVATFDLPTATRHTRPRTSTTSSSPKTQATAVTTESVTQPTTPSEHTEASPLPALAKRLAELDADGLQPRITDVRLLVHVAANRLKSNWPYLKNGTEIRSRRFDPALVWAAAWLAVERQDITTRHSLVKTALEYCNLESLPAGHERYAEQAVSICRRRIAALEQSGGRR